MFLHFVVILGKLLGKFYLFNTRNAKYVFSYEFSTKEVHIFS